MFLTLSCYQKLLLESTTIRRFEFPARKIIDQIFFNDVNKNGELFVSEQPLLKALVLIRGEFSQQEPSDQILFVELCHKSLKLLRLRIAFDLDIVSS